ncbi:MAG: ATP-binding protein, partial [Bacteroidota bacterium]
MKNVQSDVRDKQHSTGWIHKDKMGKLMDVEITSYATHFNGRNARVVLSSDVTEQLRYLRELRETKNYLQKLLDLANSPIITLNDDLSVISINRSFERISGYTQDELISEGFIALSKSEDQVKIEALLQASMNGEKLENLEIPIRTKDGQIRHIGWNTANILSDDGDKILAILAIGTDLTERKQIEEALSKNEQLLRNIVELLPVGVWVTDKNGVIKSGNKAGNDIWTGTRLVGPEEYGTYKAWWRSNGRSIAPTDWAAYRAIKFGETSLNEEIEIECFDGARKVILNSAIPIVNDRNEITGSVVVNQDITERVEAEDKIRNVNSALVEAKRRAEESDRLKTFLLQNMSHEFRTPMNSILGFSALIGDESTDHDARQLAVRIHDAGNRLMKTLDDILALSQIQAEIRPDQVCPVNLYEEIVGLMPGYMNTAAEKRLKISLNSIEKPVVVMNPTHLVHAINHLLDNAIKFTREGEIMIEVCNQVSNLQSMAMIKISDTGIGIAPDNFSLIFEAFRQASEGYGRSFEGTGLGLTIAKRMIELNGGTIKVESQPGKGSSFTILLPAVTDEAGVQSTVIPRLKPGHGTIHSGIDKGYEIGKIQDKTLIKLLIVEDNTDNIELIKLYLDKNFSCDTANNADAAIRMCHSGVYPIILMDINLGPGKNGMEATREIRRMTGYEHTPIIAITGFTDQNDKEKIFESGCSHYLGKPFSQRALLETVKTALNQSKEKIFQD